MTPYVVIGISAVVGVALLVYAFLRRKWSKEDKAGAVQNKASVTDLLARIEQKRIEAEQQVAAETARLKETATTAATKNELLQEVEKPWKP